MTTSAIPQAIRPRRTRSRLSSGELATTSAQLVENGLESTTDAEIDSAAMRPTAPTEPEARKGTASGISAPRMPVVEANRGYHRADQADEQRGEQRRADARDAGAEPADGAGALQQGNVGGRCRR